MSALKLAGLAVSIRIAADQIHSRSMLMDPAVAIIFADPIARDLEQLTRFDKMLYAKVSRILAADDDDEDGVDCRHWLNSSLMEDDNKEEMILKVEPSDDQLSREDTSSLPNGVSDLLNDHHEPPDGVSDLLNDNLEPPDGQIDDDDSSRQLERAFKMEVDGAKLSSWPYTKVSIYFL